MAKKSEKTLQFVDIKCIHFMSCNDQILCGQFAWALRDTILIG